MARPERKQAARMTKVQRFRWSSKPNFFLCRTLGNTTGTRRCWSCLCLQRTSRLPTPFCMVAKTSKIGQSLSPKATGFHAGCSWQLPPRRRLVPIPTEFNHFTPTTMINSNVASCWCVCVRYLCAHVYAYTLAFGVFGVQAVVEFVDCVPYDKCKNETWASPPSKPDGVSYCCKYF